MLTLPFMPSAVASDGPDGFARGSRLHRRHLQPGALPTEFALLDREWTLLPGVFAPVYTPVTRLFTSWLPYPCGGRFLEMGSGAGVTAVTAALLGCEVTALDIAEASVHNTRLNAIRHGVADRVQVHHSDLFEAVADDERFDLIYWNSSFALPPPGFSIETEIEHAFFDPGYATHRRFIAEAGRYLARGGRLLLGFSDLGSCPELAAACAAGGRSARIIRSERVELDVTIEFQLVELLDAGDAR
jgi:release factor glutamine methyltransferase